MLIPALIEFLAACAAVVYGEHWLIMKGFG
jgi:hypothetical protein